ncbi:MAG: hypothetical protein AAGD05_10830 [Bacteroidota bacterium]
MKTLSTLLVLGLFFFSSCGDDSDCELLYTDLMVIDEAELPQEIVTENYQNFDNVSALNSFTLELSSFPN